MIRQIHWQLRMNMMMALIAGTIFGLASSGFAADKDASRNADVRFAKDIEKLANQNKVSPEETAQKDRAEFDAILKEGGDYARSTVQFAQWELGAFGYAVGPFDGIMNEQTRRALKEYQEYNHLPPTGNLNWETYNQINKDAAILDDEPIALLMKIFFYQDESDKFVSIRGTWIMVKDKIAYPNNAVEIACYREVGYCFEANGQMIATHQLAASGYLWEIDHWDDVEIVSKPDDAGVCSRNVLRLNRVTKSATKLSIPKLDVGICKGGHEILSRLVDGETVWSPRFNKYHLDRQRIERGHWEQFEKQWRSK